MNENDSTAVGFKPEIHTPQWSQSATDRLVALPWSPKHEEATRPSPQQLSPDSSRAARPFIPGVDLVGRDPAGQSPLEQPSLMDRLPKPLHAVRLQFAPESLSQFHHAQDDFLLSFFPRQRRLLSFKN